MAPLRKKRTLSTKEIGKTWKETNHWGFLGNLAKEKEKKSKPENVISKFFLSKLFCSYQALDSMFDEHWSALFCFLRSDLFVGSATNIL
jgi:hypothetical protein